MKATPRPEAGVPESLSVSNTLLRTGLFSFLKAWKAVIMKDSFPPLPMQWKQTKSVLQFWNPAKAKTGKTFNKNQSEWPQFFKRAKTYSWINYEVSNLRQNRS